MSWRNDEEVNIREIYERYCFWIFKKRLYEITLKELHYSIRVDADWFDEQNEEDKERSLNFYKRDMRKSYVNLRLY